MRFLFLLWYCLVKHFGNIIQFVQEISWIWWDKFICNFKYIFINKTDFIKKNCNSCGQINKYSFMGWGGVLWGPKERGWEKKIFLVMRGKVGMGQDKIMQGKGEDPILRTRPILLPSLLQLNTLQKVFPPHFLISPHPQKSTLPNTP